MTRSTDDIMHEFEESVDEVFDRSQFSRKNQIKTIGPGFDKPITTQHSPDFELSICKDGRIHRNPHT